MIKLEDYGYCAVEVYFSAACNLKCRYCFQPSVPERMKEVNKKCIDWISSGRMEDDIEEHLGPSLIELSLWGGGTFS